MKKLLVVLASLFAFSCHPVPAGAEDTPKALETFKQRLLEDARKNGVEPGTCVVELIDENDELNIMSAQCSNTRYMCLFAVRKSDGAVRPVACQDNPEFKEPERIDSRTKL